MRFQRAGEAAGLALRPQRGIDRFGPDGLTAVVAESSVLARRAQTGLVYSYALVMLLGVFGLMTWQLWPSVGGLFGR